jgi:hypothetical protein
MNLRRACGLAMLGATLASCSQPVGPYGEPVRFVTLGSLDEAVDASTPADSILPLALRFCPAALPPSSLAVRHHVAGMSGSMMLTPSITRQSAGFGRDQGVVYSDPTLGYIAIAFDDKVPIISYFSRASGATQFAWTCRIDVGGRVGALYFDGVPPTGDAANPDPSYGYQMLLLLTSSAGRRVNISIGSHILFDLKSPIPEDSFGDRHNRRMLALLDMARSIVWD